MRIEQSEQVEQVAGGTRPSTRRPGRLQQWWQRVFAEPLRRIDQESRSYLASPASRGPDWKTVTVMVTAAVALTLQNYFGKWMAYVHFARLLRFLGLQQLSTDLTAAMLYSENAPLNRLTYWSVGWIIVYFVIPALVIRLLFRERLRDYGLKLTGVFRDFWIYGVMFVIMVPLIFLCSANEHFQETYPFYPVSTGEPLWPNLWRWEAMYAVQFFALEFFFRGFMVHGTRHRYGLYSVFAMMVPYCMIHFGKPLPECCGAIVAGIALGFMSLKTRSIWLGAVIHVTVALSMDFASMWRQGIIP
jgi:membrane protease YdiL (CAAX protease family)